MDDRSAPTRLSRGGPFVALPPVTTEYDRHDHQDDHLDILIKIFTKNYLNIYQQKHTGKGGVCVNVWAQTSSTSFVPGPAFLINNEVGTSSGTQTPKQESGDQYGAWDQYDVVE